MKGGQKNFPHEDYINGTNFKIFRCPIHKPYSRECNHDLCALKSNKKTPYFVVAVKVTDIPRKENTLLCTNS